MSGDTTPGESAEESTAQSPAVVDMEFRRLDVAVDDAGVCVAAIDNPPINLFDRDLFLDMSAFAAAVAADESVRVVVLRSKTDGFFIAHFDVSLIVKMPADEPAVPDDELTSFHVMVEQFRTMPKPTICEIRGRVGGGGGELAASCDMRFGALDGAVLCQMEVPLGILPGGSGTQRLPSLVGRGRAMEIVLGGDDIDAATLERWGWLNRAMPADELSEFVDRLAARMAEFPPEAIARAKQATLVPDGDRRPGLLEEAFLFQQTLRTDAAQQRMRNFLERGGQTVEGESRVGALGAELG